MTTTRAQRPRKYQQYHEEQHPKSTCWYEGHATKANLQRPNYKGHQDNFNQSNHRPSLTPVLENQLSPYEAATLKKLKEKLKGFPI